jgi:hypothetical protein
MPNRLRFADAIFSDATVKANDDQAAGLKRAELGIGTTLGDESRTDDLAGANGASAGPIRVRSNDHRLSGLVDLA